MRNVAAQHLVYIHRMRVRLRSWTFLAARQLSREIPSRHRSRRIRCTAKRGGQTSSLAYRKRGGSRAYKQEGERGISLNRAIIDLRWYLVNTGGDVRSWPHTLGPHTATNPILLSPPSRRASFSLVLCHRHFLCGRASAWFIIRIGPLSLPPYMPPRECLDSADHPSSWPLSYHAIRPLTLLREPRRILFFSLIFISFFPSLFFGHHRLYLPFIVSVF